MSSVRVRHPALEALTSSVRILVVTNAYPAPERPSYGIYVARLVAALERAGHEVALAASSEQGGGWRTLRKYARLASARARGAQRTGPMSCGATTSCPPGRSRAARRARARAVRADRARHRRRERRALAAHPQGDAEGAVAGACAVFAVSDDLARAWRRSPARSATACTSSAPASTWRRSATATPRSPPPRSAGTPTGRASSTSATSSRARTSRACSRRSRRRARSGAAARSRSSATARSGPSSRRVPASSASASTCASPGPWRPPTCRAGCAPATSPASSR